jgi:hypothetical protein
MSPEFICKVFGEKAFSHGLFYQHEGALRFELSVSGTNTEMFMTAYRKAEHICNDIFEQEKEIGVCLSFYGEGTFLSGLNFFRELKEANIIIPKSYSAWTEIEIDDFDGSVLKRTFIFFKSPYSTLSAVLWGALAQDLGIKPRVVGSSYLVSNNGEFIVHPYDDRGMDVISLNKEALLGLFSTYNKWLLDYDRPEMERVYSAL